MCLYVCILSCRSSFVNVFFKIASKFCFCARSYYQSKTAVNEARRRVYSAHSVQPEMISEILFSVGILPDNLIPIYTYRVDKIGIKVLKIGIK